MLCPVWQFPTSIYSRHIAAKLRNWREQRRQCRGRLRKEIFRKSLNPRRERDGVALTINVDAGGIKKVGTVRVGLPGFVRGKQGPAAGNGEANLPADEADGADAKNVLRTFILPFVLLNVLNSSLFSGYEQ